MHTRDTARLIHILERLRDLGNTILVVEHDADILRAADHLLDLGPGAGEFGGKLLAEGVLAEIEANPASLTGRYLSGKIAIPVPTRRREPGREKLVLKGARANNLHGLDVTIPLGMLVAVTGVSGSGKSTLVHQVLYRAVARALGQTDGGDPSGVFASLTGVERLNDVVLVDQTPIGRTPRSNPITYIKGFDLVRELFAAQPEAKRLSLTPGHFSFNVPGGRCNTCEGDGTVTVEMQFLADVELPCEDCNGTRYQPRILEVQYKGKNIHDVLQMTVKEALRFFAGQTKLLEKLAVLDEIGLGYLRLGQSATTLSGGEAQRVKLAAHLASVRAVNATAKPSQASRVLYILDEPTTGLHFDDVSKLLTAFRKLIDGGGSLIVIEHNLDVIKSADWVIDLGPGGRRRRRKDCGRGSARRDCEQFAFAYGEVAGAGAVSMSHVLAAIAGRREKHQPLPCSQQDSSLSVNIAAQGTHAGAFIAAQRLGKFVADGGIARSCKIDKENRALERGREEVCAGAGEVRHGSGPSRGGERKEEFA